MLSFLFGNMTLRLGQDGFYLSRKQSRLFSRASYRQIDIEFTPWPIDFNETSWELFDTNLFSQQLRLVFESQIQKRKFRSFELVIPDSWARHFLVSPLKNAKRLSDYSAAMEKRYCDLYTDDILHWQLQMDMSSSGASLACGLPIKLIDTCVQICREYKLSLIGLRSELIENLNLLASSGMRINSGDWICVPSHASYLILVRDSYGWHRLIEVSRDEFVRTSQLASALSRLALRHHLDLPARFILIGEELPHWHAQMTKLEGVWAYLSTTQKLQEVDAA